MGSLYPGTSVSGYNSNPPPDDGTTGANNQITWSGIKSKLGDPLNTFASAVNTNVTNALNKTISGGSVVSTAVDYPATSADQGRNIVVTVSGKIVTTPDATVVLSPFVFCVNNQSSGNITIAGFGGTQNVDGATTAKLGKGRGIILWTDGVNWFSSGFVMGNLPLTNPPFGFDAPINLQLNASVGSSILTVSLKANDGTDPTTSNPVLIPFRDPTYANGDPQWVAVTGATSITTNAVGASLGSSNGVPFRLWVCAFNNGGTVVLALINCSNSTNIFALDETTDPATTGISAAATSAGIFYTPNGTSITINTKSFRIIGYVQYDSGLATAGTYATAPTKIQLFGPGVKKPGDLIQIVLSTTQSASTASSASYTSSNISASITLSSPPNIVRVRSSGGVSISASVSAAAVQMFRGSTALGIASAFFNGTASANGCTFSTSDLDLPGGNPATYTLKYASDGTHTITVPAVSGFPAGSGGRIEIEELMA